MKKKIVGIFVCMLLIATILPVTATIDKNKETDQSRMENDWWPMYRCDPGNTGFSPSIAPNTNQISWTQNIWDDVYSATPVVAEDKLYLSTDWYYDVFEPLSLSNLASIFEKQDLSEVFENIISQVSNYDGGIYCLDADDGTMLWNNPMVIPNDPAVVDGKVYICNLDPYTYGSSFFCLDADDGSTIWQKPLTSWIFSPTIVADGKAYFGGIDLYGFSGELYCYDLNGNSIWSYPTGYGEFSFSSPAVGDGKVYFVTIDWYSYYTGTLYCLDADTGALEWTKPVPSFSYFFSSASPVYANGRVYYAGIDFYSYGGTVYCFDGDTGSTVWQYSMDGFPFSTVAICEDGIYVTAFELYGYYYYGDSCLYRIDAGTGALIWKVLIPGETWYFFFGTGSPAVGDGKAYISTLDFGYYYSDTSALHCFDIDDGDLKWSYEFDYMSLCSPSIADERVYIADLYGKVYAFEDVLKIDIKSGIGLLSASTVVKNDGVADLTNISWSVSVTGGLLGMVNKTSTGTITTLEGGGSNTVRAFPVFGLGPIHVTSTATMEGVSVIETGKDGFILGPLILIS